MSLPVPLPGKTYNRASGKALSNLFSSQTVLRASLDLAFPYQVVFCRIRVYADYAWLDGW